MSTMAVEQSKVRASGSTCTQYNPDTLRIICTFARADSREDK